MIRAVVIATLVAACGKSSGGAPASRDAAPAAPSLPLEVDGEVQGSIVVAARVALWDLCDQHHAVWIELRGPKGAFVHGECDKRDAYELAVFPSGDQIAGELRAKDGVVAASVKQAFGVEIVTAQALANAPTLPPLMVSVDGAAAVALDGWVGGSGDRGGRKRGTDLAKIVELAGVPLAEVGSVVIRDPAGDYVVDPAWLRGGDDQILLRYNNRGEIRIRHYRGTTEIARRNAPKVIEIQRGVK